MTTEEVINILQNIDPQCQNDCPVSREDCAKQENKCLVSEALEYAVDFLSADVVEVVRCKNCKYREKSFYGNRRDYCEKRSTLEYTEYVNPTDFCSKGKRRETK